MNKLFYVNGIKYLYALLETNVSELVNTIVIIIYKQSNSSAGPCSNLLWFFTHIDISNRVAQNQYIFPKSFIDGYDDIILGNSPNNCLKRVVV